MSINIRERFRERKFSFLYIKKKKKENEQIRDIKKEKRRWKYIQNNIVFTINFHLALLRIS